MAAALSTTLRAALPGAPRRPQRALGLHGREPLVRRLDCHAEGLEQLAQCRRLLERRLGGRADLTREAERQPDHHRRRLDLAHGVDAPPAVPRRRHHCARSSPTGWPCSGRCR